MSKKILEKEITTVEFARQTLVANPNAGTTLQDLQAPEYWTHIARKLKPHDIIEVIPQDTAYYAKLLVIDSDKLWARVFVLEYKEIAAASSGQSTPNKRDNYKVVWGGGAVKFRVHNASDNSLASEQSFVDRDSAEEYITQLIREQAA